MSILTIESLTEINSIMLGRGAPVERDEMGYNKPDYCICQHVWHGMSYLQAADICDRLQKYTKTQLTNITITDLQESKDYYSKLAGNKQAVTLQYGISYTALYFAYDIDIIQMIKTANDRKYNAANKCWMVSNTEIISVLDKLAQIADIENAKQYFLLLHKLDNDDNQGNNQDIKQTVTKKITLSISENGQYINIKTSKYHAGYVTVVKACNDRKYNGNNYSWAVNKSEIPALMDRLQPFINEIDFAILENYIVKAKDKQEIILKPLINAVRQPFNHQFDAAKFLLEKEKAILADEMGGGKTTSAIIAAYNVDGKKLIVCPASLKLNWKKEILLVDKTAKIGVVNGKTITELNDCEWYIINYDILAKHLSSVLVTDFTSAIFDECHYIKSISNGGKPTAERGKAALQIAEKVDNVFMLTGTPITNKTKDIFNTLKAINHPLCNKWMSFSMRYCAAYREDFGWNMDGASNMSELNAKLKPYMMRRLKTELLELPEKIRSFIPVEINVTEYTKQYNAYMRDREGMEKGIQLVKLNALRHLLAIQKIPATIEQVGNMIEQGKQIVIFTCYQEVVDQIISKYPTAGKITGDCSLSNRQDTVDNFQAGKINIVVCNIVAAGVGLTLTASDTVIFNDFDWTPANHAQAEDRIHRIGQGKNCNIIYIYASNAIMDEKLSVILEQKLQNINEIVDGTNKTMFDELTNRL